MALDTLVTIANVLHVSSDDLLMDSLDYTVKVSNHEFAELVSDCSEYEIRILLEVATAAKKSLRENRKLLYSYHK